MLGHPGQAGNLPAVEPAQFGQFDQRGQGGNRAHPADSCELWGPLIQGRHLAGAGAASGLESVRGLVPSGATSFGFNHADWTGSAARPVLALGHQQVQPSGASVDQLGQLLLDLGAGRGGLGPEGLTVGGQHRGGPSGWSWRASLELEQKCRTPAGFRTRTRMPAWCRGGHHMALAVTGGLADDPSAGMAAKQSDLLAMDGGGYWAGFGSDQPKWSRSLSLAISKTRR